MWNNLSLKEKAELIQAGVKAGYRDIDSIRERFNSFSKGNYQEPIIQRTQEQLPVENVENSDYSVVPKLDYYKDPNEQQVNRFDKGGSKKQSNLQDIAYAIMAGQGNESSSSGTGRSWSDIISSFLNRTDIVKERGKIPNNLSSLYIYGNDLGQYEEKPEWRNVGVEYDDYIEKSGRDPDNIKTYEGDIVDFDDGKYNISEESVTLPDFITDDQVLQYIANTNKTFGREKLVEDGLRGDDVGGYLTRISNVNGVPMAVHSDIWDFDKDYTKTYEEVPDWQVKALNKVGNPFILKQLTPIIYENADTWYPKNELEQHMADNLGILPEVVVTAKAKKKSNGGKINRF